MQISESPPTLWIARRMIFFLAKLFFPSIFVREQSHCFTRQFFFSKFNFHTTSALSACSSFRFVRAHSFLVCPLRLTKRTALPFSMHSFGKRCEIYYYYFPCLPKRKEKIFFVCSFRWWRRSQAAQMRAHTKQSFRFKCNQIKIHSFEWKKAKKKIT